MTAKERITELRKAFEYIRAYLEAHKDFSHLASEGFDILYSHLDALEKELEGERDVEVDYTKLDAAAEKLASAHEDIQQWVVERLDKVPEGEDASQEKPRATEP